MAPWNEMLVPTRYSDNIHGEYLSIRKSAGLTDMSGIKKVWISGPESQLVLDKTITIDCTKINPGFGAYTAVLNDYGCLIDDAIVFRLKVQESKKLGAEWLLCFGAGQGLQYLKKSAIDKN